MMSATTPLCRRGMLRRGIALRSAVLLSACLLSAVGAGAAAIEQSLKGSWAGQGTITFDDGQREAIACRAYYTRDEGHTGIALRCASTSFKVEIRSRVKFDGAKVTGTWEERTYNANGAVTGDATDSRMHLKVDGGAFTGDMLVTQTGAQQSISVNTSGIKLKSVSVKLSKSE